ncbi:uncharacterized protein LOC121052244 [Rosa chinensis]|uniref:uncharacterized protein LOC121052244 n=1 Tax=Rosa chinensis TaxID=74649 RepID=UPI001AD90769|nr:uncharacterized protein LOC121052244 [Rosa chinensis]
MHHSIDSLNHNQTSFQNHIMAQLSALQSTIVQTNQHQPLHYSASVSTQPQSQVTPLSTLPPPQTPSTVPQLTFGSISSPHTPQPSSSAPPHYTTITSVPQPQSSTTTTMTLPNHFSLPEYTVPNSSTLAFPRMQPHNPYPFDNQCFRPPKVDLPRFYGDNAAGGLSMAERYLRTQNIPTHAHIATVASHFGPTASIWMNSFDQRNPSASWEQFVGAFLQHFGGCTTIDFKVSLSHMQQTSSVDAFINEFTTLAYRAPEWSDANLLSIFIGGLKPAIRHDVVAIEPRSLAYAQRLARRYETKQADNQPSRPPHPSNWSYSHKALPSNIPSAPTTHTTTSQITPFSHPDTSQKQKAETPLCKWSTSKQREGRAQGLCYSCDEQWSQTHVGKRPVMAILESPTPLEELPIEEIVEEEQPSDSEQFIPIHAITHTMIGHMMRCKGFINKQPISVFVDCRSATNFLNPVVATRLGLTMQPVS